MITEEGFKKLDDFLAAAGETSDPGKALAAALHRATQKIIMEILEARSDGMSLGEIAQAASIFCLAVHGQVVTMTMLPSMHDGEISEAECAAHLFETMIETGAEFLARAPLTAQAFKDGCDRARAAMAAAANAAG